MSNPRTLGPWLRRFLTEYIVTERNLARNTQKRRPRPWRSATRPSPVRIAPGGQTRD